MVQKFPAKWEDIMSLAFSLNVLTPLGNKLDQLDQEQKLTPPGESLFRAFELCSPEELSVIILGQDPYPTPGDADGLCFSAPRITPSMWVVFKAMEMQGFGVRTRTRLDDLAVQGVLLANTVLSTEPGKILAHANIGWDVFTNHLMQGIASGIKHPFVVLAWGKPAKELADRFFAHRTDVLVLQSCHPSYVNRSPRQADFYIHHMFQRTNDFLIKNGRKPIYWNPQQPVADFHKLYPQFFAPERSDPGTPTEGDPL